MDDAVILRIYLPPLPKADRIFVRFRLQKPVRFSTEKNGGVYTPHPRFPRQPCQQVYEVFFDQVLHLT
jgi:hypothetical protein